MPTTFCLLKWSISRQLLGRGGRRKTKDFFTIIIRSRVSKYPSKSFGSPTASKQARLTLNLLGSIQIFPTLYSLQPKSDTRQGVMMRSTTVVSIRKDGRVA